MYYYYRISECAHVHIVINLMVFYSLETMFEVVENNKLCFMFGNRSKVFEYFCL